MDLKIGNDWDDILKEEFGKEYFKILSEKVDEERQRFCVFPSEEKVFNAFKFCPYSQTKVVILGQDPYYKKGQANGLAFSVDKGVKVPPSLQNIFKELKADLAYEIPLTGELEKWAKKGVLLLNSTLTVREGKANSHSNFGWQILTDKVITLLDERPCPPVFIFWGDFARKKKTLVKNAKVIEGSHPSPRSSYRGFFNQHYFSKANAYLKQAGQEEIDWNLSEEKEKQLRLF